MPDGVKAEKVEKEQALSDEERAWIVFSLGVACATLGVSTDSGAKVFGLASKLAKKRIVLLERYP
jgi:hypothetical protein